LNPPPNNPRQYAPLRRLVLLVSLWHPLLLSAETQKSELPLTSSATVEELLRLDSRAALEVARKQVFGAVPGAPGLADSASELPELVAIYGTGRNLSAELLIAGRTVIYHGASRQSVSGVTHGYALERIAPPCVYLKKDQSQEIACLEMRTP